MHGYAKDIVMFPFFIRLSSDTSIEMKGKISLFYVPFFKKPVYVTFSDNNNIV